MRPNRLARRVKIAKFVSHGLGYKLSLPKTVLNSP